MRVALGAILVALGMLAVFGLIGDALLKGIGIPLPAFRISGGLLLFLMAVDMLFERRSERRERRTEADDGPDPVGVSAGDADDRRARGRWRR